MGNYIQHVYQYKRPEGTKLRKIPSILKEKIDEWASTPAWMYSCEVYKVDESTYYVEKFDSYTVGIINLILIPLTLIIHGLKDSKEVFRALRVQLDRNYSKRQGRFIRRTFKI